ncbi:MAG: SGNH/GDSL hydrolase family protein [Kineosporiaceae bacterium]
MDLVEPGARRRRPGPRAVLAVAALLAAVGVPLAVPSASPALAQVAPAAATATVRVMPLGDSLTGGPGCWRAPLWTRLQATGYTGIDFVGTLPGGGCGVGVWDGDNEGHGGYQAYTIAHQDMLPAWLAAARPDVVMMTLGTNDVWNHRTVTEITDSFTVLLAQMRAANPRTVLLVAQIPPMTPGSCDYCLSLSTALNATIPGWAAAASTAASPVSVVDLATGWTPATDTTDGVHQTDAGNAKFAERWYAALTAVLDGRPVTPSPSSTSPSTTPGTTSPRPTTTTPTTTGPTTTTPSTTTPSTTRTRTCKNPKKCTPRPQSPTRSCKNPRKCTAS